MENKTEGLDRFFEKLNTLSEKLEEDIKASRERLDEQFKILEQLINQNKNTQDCNHLKQDKDLQNS